MRNLADFLRTRLETFKKSFFADQEGIVAAIRIQLAEGAPPFSITYRRGIIVVQGPPALKSELFLRREKVLAALRKAYPQVRVDDIR